MIETRKLVKTFGFRPVLRGVDMKVGRGECVALLGSNGSGKTTLMRILASLSRPSRGEVVIGGWVLPREASEVRSHIGYLGHQPLLYDDLSAEENLRFFARLYRADTTRIPAVLERVGLGKRAADIVGTFSRGMQQRLGLARAILHNPDIILFDEPYTGLDVDGTEMLDRLIGDLLAEGRTVLLTSHDLDRALSLSQKIVILNRGQIAETAQSRDLTPAGLAQLYANALHG